MKLFPETTGFVRGGMLFLEQPERWRCWQRDVWRCCGVASTRLPTKTMRQVDLNGKVVRQNHYSLAVMMLWQRSLPHCPVEVFASDTP